MWWKRGFRQVPCVRVEGRGDGRDVGGGKQARRDPGHLPRPFRVDAVAASQRLQQGVLDRVCAATRAT